MIFRIYNSTGNLIDLSEFNLEGEVTEEDLTKAQVVPGRGVGAENE